MPSLNNSSVNNKTFDLLLSNIAYFAVVIGISFKLTKNSSISLDLKKV